MDCVFESLASTLEDLELGRVDSRRVFHGRGRCFSGLEFLTIDLYCPVLSVVFFDEVSRDWEIEFIDRLSALIVDTPLEGVLLQRRYLAGAPAEVVYGRIPDEVFAQRGDQRFYLKLGQRQNSGFFLDMEPGRKWLEERCEGKKILNLFSYTCTFSVVALEAGAKHVVNVDMSRGALSQGRENHRLNGLSAEGSKYLAENVLKSWGRIKRPGPYDLAVIDPPSYQPGSFVAKKDYLRVVRRIPELLKPGGEVLACLNAPEMGEEFLRGAFEEMCPDCEFVERLESSPDFPDVDGDRRLKLVVFRYSPSE
ncbi:MAG: 23S rRNA (cytosine1962-C5)-methyltransferase [Candidatus Pelagisphaera sp.]|jgi:23S rRNA (cytosine1962-C5)-methyltransferase